MGHKVKVDIKLCRTYYLVFFFIFNERQSRMIQCFFLILETQTSTFQTIVFRLITVEVICKSLILKSNFFVGISLIKSLCL